MSGVFGNIGGRAHSRGGEGEGHTRCVERGWGVNSSEDARHCSVLYICKYFMGPYPYPYHIQHAER
jgi:hypothetical protein